MKSYLKRCLRGKLSPEELKKVIASFDIVGDIAIIKIPPDLEERKKLIAQTVMEANKGIKTVLNQKGPIEGVFRIRKLEHVLGEKKTWALHREYGCIFKVDLAKVYFSPRLSYERIRVGKLVEVGEDVLNMFAGVGCFSIMIAKHSPVRIVHSIDINPEAVRLMEENILLNKVSDRVEAILGDAREIVEEEFCGSVDRVLMPLPEKAYEYLDSALRALRDGMGFIHYYDFVHVDGKEKPCDKVVERVGKKLGELGVKYDINSSRVVRLVGPYWYQVVLDIRVGGC